MPHLKDILGDTVRDRCERARLTPRENEVRKCVLRVFAARGSPPDPKEIADLISGTPEMREKLPMAREIPDMVSLSPEMPDVLQGPPENPDMHSLPPENPDISPIARKRPDGLPLPPEKPDILPKIPAVSDVLPVPSEIEVLQALARLHAADILTLRGGRIVAAYPFSAAETRHLVVFSDGHTAYALCAADALGIHFLLDEDITVRSLCPECGREIVIVLEGGKIQSCDPAGAIEFVKARDRCGCHADACCPDLNFFCGPDHLAQWQECGVHSREGVVFSLEEALEESRSIFKGFLG
ncbi:hypothetical protein J2741_001512 [Methanolinea mesophila]|uniref:alkylmercury lyase family protein n=1 Tax=Methanolinea mesophila TaxID=547055 RepID=UPI001AE43108|nr:alkylmercury lyase family protein [Methanolinea mesophila]MBP1928965.1 hypothetical protein [Methanolinea mesophila]